MTDIMNKKHDITHNRRPKRPKSKHQAKQKPYKVVPKKPVAVENIELKPPTTRAIEKTELSKELGYDPWPVIDTFFAQDDIRTLVQHQINSYHDFVDNFIIQTIENHSPIVVDNGAIDIQSRTEYHVVFKGVHMSKPLFHENNDSIRPLMPKDARLRGLSYSSHLFVDIEHWSGPKESADVMTDLNVCMCQLPTMIQSKYCYLSEYDRSLYEELGESKSDPGGYFIIKGSEKVVIAQERMSDNKVMCFERGTGSTKPSTAEIRSTIDQRFFPIKTIIVQKIKVTNNVFPNTIAVTTPFTGDTPIPLFIMFRALGFISDKDIFSIILGKIDGYKYQEIWNMLRACGYYATYPLKDSGKKHIEMSAVKTQADAIKFISRYVSNFNIKMVKEGVDPEKKRLEFTMDLITREFLPHCGNDFQHKIHFLAYMVNRLFQCLTGSRNWDDRDNVSNKRVDLVGPLLAQIFRTNFIGLVRDIKKSLSNSLRQQNSRNQSIRRIIQSCNIGNKIKYSLSTGNWATSKMGVAVPESKKGIAQVLQRQSHIGPISHLRRIKSPLERSGSKIVAPRKTNGTQNMLICPTETPEGGEVGIVKNMALLLHVTIESSPIPIMRILYDYKDIGLIKLKDIKYPELDSSTRVLVNGNYIGIIPNNRVRQANEILLILRRHTIISPFISIAWDYCYSELIILTDGGRYCAPFFITNKSNDNLLIIDRESKENTIEDNPNTDFSGLLSKQESCWPTLIGANSDAKHKNLYNGSVIEYLDVVELNSAMVSDNQERLRTNSKDNSEYLWYTHCVLHPQMIHGAVAQMIPFPDHNPAPRNCYQASMAKQAIGDYVTNPEERMDTMSNILIYPQEPSVRTKTCKYAWMDRMLHGYQSIVSVQCFTGYNQEDSVIQNKDSIMRGLFNSVFSRTYYSEIMSRRSGSGQNEIFGVPDPTQVKRPKMSWKRAIDNGVIDNKTGFPIKGKHVDGDDIIMGKYIELSDDATDGGRYKYKDVSPTIRPHEGGIIDRVIPGPNEPPNINEDGRLFCRARISSLRKPIIGDKFASRSAQKGTIGMLYPQEDMPFTSSGVVPEIIMNPHAIPSRMTIQTVLETLLAKTAVHTGRRYDATPFTKFDRKEYEEMLEEFGYQRYCDEIMYNGQTGEQILTPIFIGPTYYQRLKHMVEDKIHSRDTLGPVQLLTRQPAEGRSRNGGLRLGEMERDCLISHGVSQFLKERMIDSSDLFKVYVGKESQTIMAANPEQNIYRYNDQVVANEEVVEVQLPYAMKLLWQELTAMGLDIKIVTDDD